MKLKDNRTFNSGSITEVSDLSGPASSLQPASNSYHSCQIICYCYLLIRWGGGNAPFCLHLQVLQKVAKSPRVSNNPHSRCACCRQGYYGSSNHLFPDTAVQTTSRCSKERLPMFKREKCKETKWISPKLGKTSPSMPFDLCCARQHCQLAGTDVSFYMCVSSDFQSHMWLCKQDLLESVSRS